MKNLKFTLKAWPVIAIATIGLCYLTQAVAKLFGVELPDQENIEIVKRYAGWNLTFAFLCLQILVLMPALEELLFRWLLFMLPVRLWGKRQAATTYSLRHIHRGLTLRILSAALFSAAHYIAQPFPDAAFLALFFFGLAQCWLYRKTDRLWCAMLNHGLFNLTNLILMFVIPQA